VWRVREAHPEGSLHREGDDRREKKPEEWTGNLGMPDLCGEVPGEELRLSMSENERIERLQSVVAALVERQQAQARLIEELAGVWNAHGQFLGEMTRALLTVLDELGKDSMVESLLEKMAEMTQSLNHSGARLEEWRV